MVYRVFVEKKKELANEAKSLLGEARNLLGISGLTDVRVINRYDAENIQEDLFESAKITVFSEPQLDLVSESLDTTGAACVFGGMAQRRACARHSCAAAITALLVRVALVMASTLAEPLARMASASCAAALPPTAGVSPEASASTALMRPPAMVRVTETSLQ